MYHQLVKLGCYALIAMSAMVSSGAQAANSRPVAYSAKLTLQEDVRTTIQLRATDANRDALTYKIVKAPQYGTITQAKDKPTLLYVPHINYAGSDTFTFTANDKKLTSAVATINLTIKAVNDAPVGATQNLKTNQNTALPITLRATDVENDRLTYRISQSPTNGTLSSISGASLRYTPKTGYVGTDSFLFIAKDASKDSSATRITITVSKPTLSGRLLLLDPTQNNAELGISQVAYTTQASQGTVSQFFQSITDFFGYQSSTSNTATTGSTSSNGSFSYLAGDNISIQLAGKVFSLPAKAKITQYDLATAVCQGSADVNSCIYTTNVNLTRLLLNADDDQTTSNGIQPSSWLANNTWVLNSSIDEFATRLGRYLAAYGIVLKPIYRASLGINTEAPQAEQNNIVLPMPFVDIFRTARPFSEGSCKDVTYDEHGWPNVAPPATCSSGQALIRTFLLNDVLQGMVPTGKYTVLYEGDGKLFYSGYAKIANPPQSSVQGRDIIEITPPTTLATGTGAANYMMLKVMSGTVKNIRVVMPGGVCSDTPFIRVEKKEDCTDQNKYVSFETTLAANRNAIVFNPDYLRFLKDFRVIRMMNLMQVSPSYLACAKPDPSNPTNPNLFERNADGQVILDQNCVTQPLIWDQRSKMDSAVWGASGNSFRLARYGKAAPIEVQVALANQLNAHPWFNIPHNATESYVREFARYVAINLKPNLKAHIEYSNETWNGLFWAYYYMLEKGATELGDNTAWRGAFYYARQSRNVFQWWEDEFGGTQRLIRILATYQNDSNRTKRMLDYGDTKQYVDAIAMGAYFYACWENNNPKLSACNDSNKIPKPLVNARSVNDIFAAIDNPLDPYGMEGVKSQFTRQAAVAKDYGKALYAYEGGQHLTILGAIDQNRKQNMIDLMHAANQSPDMGERYKQLLESWKAVGGQTFMLFSVPHTFSQHGSFGIKTRLDQPRSSAPKYDAAMKFQETQGKCWWNGC